MAARGYPYSYQKGDIISLPESSSSSSIDELLESITLTAEMAEISAVSDKPASGVVLEARLDKGRGKVTTALNKTYPSYQRFEFPSHDSEPLASLQTMSLCLALCWKYHPSIRRV